MSYIRGEDRGQAALLPAAIEDYVGADAPVRVIDAFVDGLDVIGLGFGRSVPAATGRPPYDPRDLLKLYVYGYLNDVRSSRRLERECSRNLELMWLLRKLVPDFKTIADFRRDNSAAIVGACRAFVLFCRDRGLFAARLVALDGSKFRAAASVKRIMGRREIAEETTRLDRRIAEYLAGLNESDARELDDAPNATTTALQALRERRAELDRLAAKLDSEGRPPWSTANSMPGRWASALAASRLPIICKRQSISRVDSLSTMMSRPSRLTIVCSIRWPKRRRIQWAPIRSRWWRMPAIPMGRTRWPASATV